MNCPNCGKELCPTDKFCVGCGTKIANRISATGTLNMESVNAFVGKAADSATNSLMGTSTNGINVMVRRYFFGFGDIIWSSMIAWIIFSALKSVFGSFWGVFQVIAVIVLIAAVVMDVYVRVIGMGKNNVDEATQKSISMLKNRAKERFNVDVEQIREIDPIVIAGVGAVPTALTIGKIINFKRFSGFGKLYSKEPMEAYRIGSDRIPRYLLLQTTVYAFTDTQLLTYSGNVDISTGIIYDESVFEIFYKDINSVIQKDVLKKFKTGIFNEEYYILRYLELDICGISKIASFDSRIAENAVTSIAGMKNYIREKKY